MPRLSPPLLAALIVTLLLLGTTSVLTLIPMAGVSAPGGDKTHHMLAFAALALPLAAARPGWIPVTGGLLALYGGLIEIIQPYVGRGRELADWQADLIGIALGSLLGLALHHIYRRLRRRISV